VGNAMGKWLYLPVVMQIAGVVMLLPSETYWVLDMMMVVAFEAL